MCSGRSSSGWWGWGNGTREYLHLRAVLTARHERGLLQAVRPTDGRSRSARRQRTWTEAWARRFLVGLLGLSALAGARPSAAQSVVTPPPSAPPEPADDPKLAEAKALFRRGVALLEIDRLQALDYFLRSRELVPAGKNTLNAALCLRDLERYDEALELLEDVISGHAADVAEEDRAAIAEEIARLMAKVGTVEVSSNVDGLVVLGGRGRGRLPFRIPLRVLAGTHRIRVIKDGYSTFEQDVTVDVGATVHVDAELSALGGLGVLRIEDPSLLGARVFVDGVELGVAPWEGALSPGAHLVWTEKGEHGAAPAEVVVLAGQTALIRVASGNLGPTLRIRVSPPTAQLHLDGVALRRGSWSGRLPRGTYRVEASAPGHVSRSLSLVVEGAGEPSREIAIELPPSAPPPRPSPGTPFVQAFAGVAAGAGLGGDAEYACPTFCSGGTEFVGALAGARAGYRLRSGLAPELSVGYLTLGAGFGRTVDTSFVSEFDGSVHSVSYEAQDDISVRGPLLLLGASYRWSAGPLFAVTTAATTGVLLGRARDTVLVTAHTTGPAVPATLARSGAVAPSTSWVVAPEVRVDVTLGGLRAGLGLLALGVLSRGDALDHGELGVSPDRCDAPADPGNVACAPNTGALAGERAHGRFIAWVPELVLEYSF